MEKIAYDIHGLIAIEFCLKYAPPGYQAFDVLEVFRAEPTKNPDILVRFHENVEKPANSFVVNHRNFITKREMFSQGRYRNLTYQVRYAWLDNGNVTVDIYFRLPRHIGGLRGYAIAQNFFVLPLIEIELLRRGIITVHSAGLTLDNEGYVLVGRGGVFKTTVAMWMSRLLDFEYLGDDKVLINDAGKLFSYQTLPRLYEFRKEHLKDERITLFHKIRFLFSRSGRRSRTKLLPRNAMLTKVVFVERRIGRVKMKTITKEEAIRKLISNYKLERATSVGIAGYVGSVFEELIRCRDFIYPDSVEIPSEQQFKDICKQVFLDEEYPMISCGEDFSSDFYEAIVKSIEA